MDMTQSKKSRLYMQDTSFYIHRKSMVENQLRANKVSNNLISDAFLEIPRELFVTSKFEDLAYIDEDIQISENRYMMKPMILGRFIQSFDIKGNETVLHIGSNTGYASAVMSKLVSTVISIESNKSLFEKSVNIMNQLNIDNVIPLNSALSKGFEKEAPYDIIFIEGSIEEKPINLFSQLNKSGILATVIRFPESPLGKGYLFKKNNGYINEIELFDAQTFTLDIFKKNIKFKL